MAKALTPEFLATARSVQERGGGQHFIQVDRSLAEAYKRREDWALDYIDAVWVEKSNAGQLGKWDDLNIISEDGEFLLGYSG